MATRNVFFFLSLVFCVFSQAQDSTVGSLPSGYLSAASARIGTLESKLDKKSEKALRDFQQQEERIYRKLARVDSTGAARYLAASRKQYQQLEQKLRAPLTLTQYLPFLDTLKTSLKYLQEHQELLGKAQDVQNQLSDAAGKVKELEVGLAKAETIKQFLKERRQQLKEQLINLPLARELKKLNKQAYYYSAQVGEYKEVLKDPKKIERKALELLSKTRAFQDFMQKNSQLASLFRLPGGDNADPGAALAGLQTRAQVNGMIQQRIAAGGPNAASQVRENMQAAQGQLSELKNKLAQYSSGDYGNTSSDIEQPDFRPNNQRTKSMRQRIVVGTDVQSQRARYFFPVTTDLGLSAGFKANDKSIIGLGVAYRLGLGAGWQHLELSHSGIGLRSFVDYKLKGSLYVSGGYEQNYRSEIRSVDQLKDYSAWQSSGLVGLAKRYALSKKLKGEMKLLWDFLSYQQVPQTQAVLFRVGYSFK